MSSPSKKKGSQFETDVVGFLREHGLPHVERRALRGTKDCGDLSGVPGWVFELKNHQAMDLGTWMAEAEKEALNDGSYRHVVIHKRRGKNVRHAYATMPLWLLAELLVAHARVAPDLEVRGAAS